MANGPKFYAYTVKDRAGKKPVWTRIGSAWSHERGGGLNVDLQALPMDGRIVLLPPLTEEHSEDGDGRAGARRVGVAFDGQEVESERNR